MTAEVSAVAVEVTEPRRLEPRGFAIHRDDLDDGAEVRRLLSHTPVA